MTSWLLYFWSRLTLVALPVFLVPCPIPIGPFIGCPGAQYLGNYYIRQGGNVFVGVCLFVCLSVCQKDNSKNYGRIFLKFWGNVGHGISYKWFDFGGDPAGILDCGSLWNFRYHCVKGGIREPLAKRIWWHYLANSIALAEVPGSLTAF